MRSDNVLITGSSSGLGAELAFVYARKGHNIVITGRNENNLLATKSIINELGVECEILQGDLNDVSFLDELVSKGKEKDIKVLINNAALLCEGKKITDLSDDYVRKSIFLNFYVPVYLAKSLYNEVSSIININSVAGIERKKNRTLYCSTKAALKAFSETLSLESDKNIMDVYISKLKKTKDDFGLSESVVASKIYECYRNKEKTLTLDGRKK